MEQHQEDNSEQQNLKRNSSKRAILEQEDEDFKEQANKISCSKSTNKSSRPLAGKTEKDHSEKQQQEDSYEQQTIMRNNSKRTIQSKASKTIERCTPSRETPIR